jgi:hypothetical protein
MRSGRLAFAAVAGAGMLALLLTSVADRRDLAFTLGVQPAEVAAVLMPGHEVCQRPIDTSADAARVRFRVGTYGRPGPPLEVSPIVEHRSSSEVVIAGFRKSRVGGGYASGATLAAPVSNVKEGDRLRLCVRNAGREKVALYGNGPAAARTSAAFLDGKQLNTDLTLVFERSSRRSMLATFPDMFERAALWHPGWVGAWTFWVLLAFVLVGVPLLLWRALAASERIPAGSYDSRP